MKSRRALMMLGLAMALGLAAVLLAARWLRQPAASTVRIAVAASDVGLGQRLAPDMLALAEWPAASVPAGAQRDLAALAGRVLKAAVQRGEPVTEARLAPAGTLGGLSALIAEGKRAITVRVNDVVGVAGFALPGNFVDILVYAPAEQRRQRRRNCAVENRAGTDPGAGRGAGGGARRYQAARGQCRHT